jgi:hypothetical protein
MDFWLQSAEFSRLAGARQEKPPSSGVKGKKF